MRKITAEALYREFIATSGAKPFPVGKEGLIQECARLICQGESVSPGKVKQLPEGTLGRLRSARRQLLARYVSEDHPEQNLKIETPKTEKRRGHVDFVLESVEPRVPVRRMKCDECNNTKPHLTRYLSDQGPVNVCSDCRPQVFERSFPHLSVKTIRGGGVGTAQDRYRHH